MDVIIPISIPYHRAEGGHVGGTGTRARPAVGLRTLARRGGMATKAEGAGGRLVSRRSRGRASRAVSPPPRVPGHLGPRLLVQGQGDLEDRGIGTTHDLRDPAREVSVVGSARGDSGHPLPHRPPIVRHRHAGDRRPLARPDEEQPPPPLADQREPSHRAGRQLPRQGHEQAAFPSVGPHHAADRTGLEGWGKDCPVAPATRPPTDGRTTTTYGRGLAKVIQKPDLPSPCRFSPATNLARIRQALLDRAPIRVVNSWRD